jgi:probable rRNA maturation factor
MTRVVQISDWSKRLHYDEAKIHNFYKFLDTLRTPAIPCGELSIAFFDETAMRRLHKDFLDEETCTDVITFPGNKEMGFAGEICVCVDYAKRSAAQRDLSFSFELNLYLVHGWLHLAGYNDYSDKERQVMRQLEANILSVLEKKGKILTFSLRDE